MKALSMAAVCAVAVWGCDRTHMDANFGASERTAFRAQIIHPDAGDSVGADQPLDPEEAVAVVKKYRKQQSPGSENSGSGQLLVVPNQQQPGGQ